MRSVRIRLVLGMTFLFMASIFSKAQSGQSPKPKYQGLLWEISGKGMKKPSYLYGTMHVSNKLAFRLSDSFYIAIKSADVVALEIDPDIWMDEMYKRDYFHGNASSGDYLNDEVFKINRRLKENIVEALKYDPEMINYLMFRYSDYQQGDFEEDTYLDLYIYKTGKKLGKEVLGIEKFDELDKIRQMAMKKKDTRKNRRRHMFRNYRGNDDEESGDPLENAYRKGDLDMLDSINKLSASEGFIEYMINLRNKIMADRIDSILHKNSLFVGVGAAHLPGDQGVINFLRKMGYKLRPVTPGEINSREKDKIDKIHFPLSYSSQQSADGFFQVDMPGKIYEMPFGGSVQYYLHPEMVNGAYYTVTRIKTYGAILGRDQKYVLKVVDSLLFENIPGKILSKKPITRFGYVGYDIQNKTRRGDYQRYQILCTPFELLIFKLGGTGSFAKGKDGERFFGSIKIKEQSAGNGFTEYSAPFSGFKTHFPHAPITNQNQPGQEFYRNKIEYHAYDASKGNGYLLVKRVFSHPYYLDEDTFELDMLSHDVLKSFNAKEKSRRFFVKDKFQGLEVTARSADSTWVKLQFFVRGSHYYMLAARYPQSMTAQDPFFANFGFQKFTYGSSPEVYTDTTYHFTVKTHTKPNMKSSSFYDFSYSNDELRYSSTVVKHRTAYCSSPFSGEKIKIEYWQYNDYFGLDTNTTAWKKRSKDEEDDELVRTRKVEIKTPPLTVTEYQYGDTATHKVMRYKTFEKGRVGYQISTVYDSLEGESDFVRLFFDTFSPSDTLIGKDIYHDATEWFLQDFVSKDSATKRHAYDYSDNFVPRDKHVSKVKQQINGFGYYKDKEDKSDKEYYSIKSSLIRSLGDSEDSTVVSYLKDLYKSVGDTTNFQLAILKTLLDIETKPSFLTFKELILWETPLTSNEEEMESMFSYRYMDSLELVKLLYPDLLKLTVFEEYKNMVYEPLADLIDSNRIKPEVYDSYFIQILADAKSELKRQFAHEEDSEDPRGNSSLEKSTVLLVPYMHNKAVKTHLNKLLNTKSDDLKLSVACELAENKKEVPDKIWKELASKQDQRILLYEKLKDIKQLDKFPQEYKNPMDMAKGIAYEVIGANSYYNKLDTLVYLDKTFTSYKGKSGYVYLFKYKRENSDDWYLVLSGFQPKDTTQFEVDRSLSGSNRSLWSDKKPLKEQFDDELRMLKIKYKHQRRNRYSRSYDSFDYDFISEY